MIYINLVYEDDLSEAVMTKLIIHFGDKFCIHNTYSGHGFGYLKANIKGFNQSSLVNPCFMLTDLDNYDCPPELINDWMNFEPNPHFIFRIAVREVESWLLADIEGMAAFLRVSAANFPREPEKENDPKKTLIKLAGRSRIRRIKEDILPINENAIIGPNYNGCLAKFVFEHWNIESALKKSESLKKALKSLDEIDFHVK